MAYRIEYDSESSKFEVISHHPRRFPLMLACSFVLFLALTFSGWQEGRTWLREFLIPGDSAVTIPAVRMLAENLEEGVSMKESLQTFCREVIQGAQGHDSG